MNKLQSDLSKVKVGDWVLTLQFGWAKVKEVNPNFDYPIFVGSETYTEDGELKGGDLFPTCFPVDQVPECFLEIYGPPPVEFEDGEACWVSEDKEFWYPRVFKHREKAGFRTYGDHNVHTLWKYCRKWKGGKR